jgi:hypothetical protein
MLFLLIAACDIEPMAQSWQIDRLRILAVAAEPAEPRPGDLVIFTSLTVSPVVPVALSTWFACVISEEQDTGCTIDPGALEDVSGADFESMTPEEQQALLAQLLAAGLIGVEPFLPPTWLVPADTLDGLSEADRLEGLPATVSITAIPDQEAVEEGDLELAYKRVPISEAATPNHNPAVAGLKVDGIDVTPGARVALDRGQTYTIEVLLADDAVETYTYVNSDGVEETRTEEPYFAWYLQEGGFDQEYTLWPYVEVQYTSPADPELDEQSLWVVVRDRRGGMSWIELPISFL